MKDEKLFDDIRQNLKRQDRRGDPHPTVSILMQLGVQRNTVTAYLTNEKVCCRATGFNLMNAAAKVSQTTERHLLDILKKSMIQAITVSKRYRKLHSLRAIERLNTGIKAGKEYLENLDESVDDIDYQGMFEQPKEENMDHNFLLAMIEHSE